MGRGGGRICYEDDFPFFVDYPTSRFYNAFWYGGSCFAGNGWTIGAIAQFPKKGNIPPIAISKNQPQRVLILDIASPSRKQQLLNACLCHTTNMGLLMVEVTSAQFSVSGTGVLHKSHDLFTKIHQLPASQCFCLDQSVCELHTNTHCVTLAWISCYLLYAKSIHSKVRSA
jgi:hypothetical protein